MGGSHIFADRVPDFDAPVAIRLREAGGILLGKTTTPEFGWKALSDSPLTGATHNPWMIGRTAGGSSAGAAASVAAGMGPLAQGSDGAGSIRIPAAFCGIYGLKPSFGRIPNHPIANNDNTSHLGPLTRTVADAALMLSVMAGPHHLDFTSLEAPPADYVGLLGRGIQGLKVGFSPDLGYLRVDPEVAQIVQGAAQAFTELGCHVEELDPGFGESNTLIEFFWNAHEAGNLSQHLPQWEGKMDPGLVASIRAGQGFTAVDYLRMRTEKIAFYHRVRAYFDRYDLLLTPSLSVAAFPVFRLQPEHWPQHPWNWMGWGSFSYPFNFTGNPAASVPAGATADGLPVGLQIVGRRFADLTVLQASAAFETARPWAQHRPALSGALPH
jgi:aspartyl-tRNA(Asn)/glutamyl-tRNA(Gln) amidotransferase subunit A